MASRSRGCGVAPGYRQRLGAFRHWGSGFKVGGKIVVEKKDDISVETILRQVRDANCIFPAGMSPSDGTRPLDAAHDASHDADGGRFMIT